MNIRIKNIPKLRFPEFNGHWEFKKLGDLGRFIGGGTPSKSIENYWSGDIPWISSSDIAEEGISNISYTRHITQDAISNSATKLIPARSVLLVSRVGVGKLAINDRDVCTSQDFTNIIPLSINAIFLAYLLKYKRQMLLGFNQGTSIKGFTKDDLVSLRICVPSKDEQKKIADFLTYTDENISSLDKKVKLLKKYKNGVMQKIFSQQIRFKDDDGNEYPKWEEKRLGDIANFLKGGYLSKEDIVEDGKIEAILYGELYTTYGEVIEKIKSRTNHDAKNLVFSKKNDLIIPSSGETHIDIATASCILKDGIALGGDMTIIRSNNNGVFLAYYLSSAKKIDIAKLGQGVSVVHLYSTYLKKLKLNIPYIKEQKKIADFLTSIDAIIQLEERKLSQAKKFKKVLLQQVFV